MNDKQGWNGIDRRKTAIEVAEEAVDTADGAKIDLSNHVVECSARYNILNSKVELQGKQVARIEQTVSKIDDKLDSIIAAFDAKMDAKVTAMKHDLDEQRKKGDERYSSALWWIIGIMAGVIGWGFDRYIMK
jgi:hypothetical protein